jgi:hypothetical protein
MFSLPKQTKLAELCEDRYGQLLQQLDILEYLFNNRLPVDVSPVVSVLTRCPY